MESTVYAKTFPLSTTEEKVTQLFSGFGRVLRVKLRRDENKGCFRGSVYVEFDRPEAAQAAIRNPPSAPNTGQRLQVMLKSDYQRMRGSGSAPDSTGTKRQRSGDVTDAQQPSQQYHSFGNLTGQQGAGYQGLPAVTGLESTGHGSGGCILGASTSGVQGLASGGALARQGSTGERDRANDVKRIAELEEALAREKAANAAMQQKLIQAQENAHDAQAQATAAKRDVLAKNVEIGALKGEVGSLRSQMAARVDNASSQYRAKIRELELQVQQLKDTVAVLKAEKDKAGKSKTGGALATLAAAAADAAATPPLPPSSATVGSLKDDLDDF